MGIQLTANVSQIQNQIRKQVGLSNDVCIFLFIGNKNILPNSTVGSLYKLYKGPDGILYLTVMEYEAFGGTYSPST